MKQQYEVISYEGQNFKYLVGSISHCMPHIHREIELGLVLQGTVTLRVNGQRRRIGRGDLWLLNPCQSHETVCEMEGDGFTFVELQLSPAFFKSYFPEISRREFTRTVIDEQTLGQVQYRQLTRLLTDSALSYLRREARYELKCAAAINEIFDLLLESLPSRLLDVQEMKRAGMREARLQRICAYIEENYDRKLLLSDLAQREELSMPHLSHFFTEQIGMPFQDYLLHLRCEKAQQLLLTDMSLAEVSLVCGFSAARYLNEGFRRIYGMTPREYREKNKGKQIASLEKSDGAEFGIGLIRHTPEECAALIAEALQ